MIAILYTLKNWKFSSRSLNSVHAELTDAVAIHALNVQLTLIEGMAPDLSVCNF